MSLWSDIGNAFAGKGSWDQVTHDVGKSANDVATQVGSTAEFVAQDVATHPLETAEVIGGTVLVATGVGTVAGAGLLVKGGLGLVAGGVSEVATQKADVAAKAKAQKAAQKVMDAAPPSAPVTSEHLWTRLERWVREHF